MTFSGERIRVLEVPLLSESSRKERRALLGFSALAFTIGQCGLVPQKISALGVEISAAQQSNLKWVLFGLVAYFLVALALYSLQDWLAWRGKIHEGLSADMKASYEDDAVTKGRTTAPNQFYTPGAKRWNEHWKELPVLHPIKYSYRLCQVRLLFEIVIPLLIGVFALYYVAGLDVHSTAVKSHSVSPEAILSSESRSCTGAGHIRLGDSR